MAAKENFTVGLALLGFQGYSKRHCREALRPLKHVNRKVLAFLWASFGESKENIHTWYAKCNEFSVTQVYLSNGSDRRKARKDSKNLNYRMNVEKYNEALEKNDPKVIIPLKERAKEVYDLHYQYGKGELRIACELEHNFTENALKNYAKAVRSAAPGIKLVSNPVGMNSYQGKGTCEFWETHDVKDRPPRKTNMIATTDGYDICIRECGKNLSQLIGEQALHDIIKKWKKAGADYFLLWHSQMNSIINTDDSATLPPPAERESTITKKCMVKLKTDYCDVYGAGQEGGQPAPPPPAVCGDKTKDPFKTPGFVWKASDSYFHEGQGTLVVVFPDSYSEPFKQVVVKEPKTGWMSFLRPYNNYTLTYFGKGNGDRQHWRDTTLVPSTLNAHCTVVVTMQNGEKICWYIKDPAERNGR